MKLEQLIEKFESTGEHLAYLPFEIGWTRSYTEDFVYFLAEKLAKLQELRYLAAAYELAVDYDYCPSKEYYEDNFLVDSTSRFTDEEYKTACDIFSFNSVSAIAGALVFRISDI